MNPVTDEELEAIRWSAYADGRDDEREEHAADTTERAQQFRRLLLLAALAWVPIILGVLWWKS